MSSATHARVVGAQRGLRSASNRCPGVPGPGWRLRRGGRRCRCSATTVRGGPPSFRPCGIAHEVHTPGPVAFRMTTSCPAPTTGPRRGARCGHETHRSGDREAYREGQPTGGAPPNVRRWTGGCVHDVQSRRFAGVGSPGATGRTSQGSPRPAQLPCRLSRSHLQRGNITGPRATPRGCEACC